MLIERASGYEQIILLTFIVVFAIWLIYIVGKISLFKKANLNPWLVLIPLYSDYLFMTKICGLHWAWFVGDLLIAMFLPSGLGKFSLLLNRLLRAAMFYNLGLKLHKNKITSAIFGAMFSPIMTTIYGLSSAEYDHDLEVSPAAFFD